MFLFPLLFVLLVLVGLLVYGFVKIYAELKFQAKKYAQLTSEKDAELEFQAKKYAQLTSEKDAELEFQAKKYAQLTSEKDAELAEKDAELAEKDAELAELRKRLADDKREGDQMSDASTAASFTIHISRVTREEVAALFYLVKGTDQCAPHSAPPYDPENNDHQKFWYAPYEIALFHFH